LEIGFTGTRIGMNTIQTNIFEELIKSIDMDEFHHGDCIGADEEAHEIVRKYKPDVQIFVHPPKEKKFRANCGGNYIAPEKNYIARDYDIVDACKRIIAVPYQKKELIRSGTWLTIRYARKANKEITIIYPDGKKKNSWE
jgi:hypothetical protein